jgi:hypothetical protein
MAPTQDPVWLGCWISAIDWTVPVPDTFACGPLAQAASAKAASSAASVERIRAGMPLTPASR